ncbi:PQQ-binding-like beta-propeller repeat protein [Curtobacterium sp. ER1/6]|uniref:PQQ-binding-like beta-propeller repeat protein n=1 Tax=Curtobacterium sp. ER1/6 TaxID=1891920 RepID=UPI00084F8B43|nr:PQQ-binding-like beta-propeller repeat protein [Curtobacterium sp. ER1/6]
MTPLRTTLAPAALLGAAALVLTGCSTGPAAEVEGTRTTKAASAGGDRIVLTYDGGLLTLDQDLRVVADDAIDGFTRVNPAGDGRHVLVTVPEGFRVLDTAAAPALTDAVFPADTGGHAVVHGEKTVLFADGSGDVTVFDHDELDGDRLPDVETTESEAAHHGVAIVLEDGTLLSTIGTEEERTGVRALDEDGEELARSEACPNVHGEGAVQGEVAVFGCTDGALVYQDGAFTKIDAPTEYGRTGNLFTTEDSSVAVGDYNDDPDSEGYLLDQVALIDAASGEYRVADMPEGVGFTFRDLARGPGDEAVVLGSDGALHTFDEQTGEPIDSFDVIDAWEGPTEWQDAHPALKVVGDVAYVTDPAEQKVHAVDLTTGKVVASSDELPGVPNEIAVA